MKRDKGLTLIEVMATMAVLAVAILIVTSVLRQSSVSSNVSTVNDRSVLIARTVLSEISNRLKSSEASIQLYEQSVDLNALRDSGAANRTVSAIYYPSAANRQYRIDIRSSNPGITVKPVTTSYVLNDSFRQIQVSCTFLKFNRSPYQLTALVQYQ